MNRERIGAKEAISILMRAFGIGLSVKNATSIICSIVGLLGAFLPVAISKALEMFSNEIQILYWGGTNYIKAEMLAILLAVLYIAQVGFQCFQDYCTKVEALKISKSIKENVIRNTCDVEYKNINNTAGYLEKIGLADEISGSKTTNAIQTTTIWLQKALSFGSVKENKRLDYHNPYNHLYTCYTTSKPPE